MPHGQGVLIDIVADGQSVVGDILKEMMAPHVAQFVLRESRGKICGGVAPRAPLQGDHVEPGIAELLSHDGPGPTKADQYCIDRLECRSHQPSLQPGRPLKPTVGKGTRSPWRLTQSL